MQKLVNPKGNIKQSSSEAIQDAIQDLETLDNLITSLAPKLKRMLSDRFGRKNRETFRNIACRRLVFDLFNRSTMLNKQLNAMCSEKARQIIKDGNTSELGPIFRL